MRPGHSRRMLEVAAPVVPDASVLLGAVWSGMLDPYNRPPTEGYRIQCCLAHCVALWPSGSRDA